MAVYTNNVPQATQTIAFTQPLIEGNFEYLENMLDNDHNFLGNDATPTDGYHNVIHHTLQVDPAPIAGIQQTYSFNDSGTTQLRSMNGAGDISRLTGDLRAASGYQWIGGVLFQWGFENSGATNSVTNFSIPFTTTYYSITITPLLSGAALSGDANRIFVRSPVAANQFAWTKGALAAGQIGFFWMAVGD